MNAVRSRIALVAAVLGLAAGAWREPGAAPAHTRGPAPFDAPRTAEGYRLAVPPWRFEFPRDHASHPSFRTEWWYYTGHLDGGGGFGFELTFFRVGIDPSRERSPSRWALHTIYFAHLALTEIDRNRFRFHEKLGRPSLGMSGADSTRLSVWIDDWSVALEPDGRTHRLRADGGDFGLDLEARADKPPAIHGQDGVSQKAEGQGNASHYYSLSRMATTGTLTVDGHARAVSGVTWMDHEFGSNQLAPGQTGWDWFGLQLDDGRELMLYRMRRKGGVVDPYSSGTLIDASGATKHLARDAFSIDALGSWTSLKTAAVYPAGWTIRVPGEGLELTVTPDVADQELVTAGTVGVHYWEGSVSISGRARPGAVVGRGYAELTGYAGRVPGF
jgi:predicted secreted hydrolase